MNCMSSPDSPRKEPKVKKAKTPEAVHQPAKSKSKVELLKEAAADPDHKEKSPDPEKFQISDALGCLTPRSLLSRIRKQKLQCTGETESAAGDIKEDIGSADLKEATVIAAATCSSPAADSAGSPSAGVRKRTPIPGRNMTSMGISGEECRRRRTSSLPDDLRLSLENLRSLSPNMSPTASPTRMGVKIRCGLSGSGIDPKVLENRELYAQLPIKIRRRDVESAPAEINRVKSIRKWSFRRPKSQGDYFSQKEQSGSEQGRSVKRSDSKKLVRDKPASLSELESAAAETRSAQKLRSTKSSILRNSFRNLAPKNLAKWRKGSKPEPTDREKSSSTQEPHGNQDWDPVQVKSVSMATASDVSSVLSSPKVCVLTVCGMVTN